MKPSSEKSRILHQIHNYAWQSKLLFWNRPNRPYGREQVKSMMDRQCNGQKEKDTHNDLQKITQTIKQRAMQTPLRIG